ncbi:MAG: hypothetical protein O2962_04430 [Cyanobacteria bacterium]|nr:hypothetical protein [Cyanobacteriota bacterium]
MSVLKETSLFIQKKYAGKEIELFGHDPELYVQFTSLCPLMDEELRRKMYFERCREIAVEVLSAKKATDLRESEQESSVFIPGIDFRMIHPRTAVRDMFMPRIKGLKNRYLPTPKNQNLNMNTVSSETPQVEDRLVFKLKTADSNSKLTRFSKSHIFGMVVAKQINELIAATKDEQELRAVARLLIKYFHPKLIKELVKQFGFDNSTDSMHKITHSKSLLFDDYNYNSNSSDTLQLIKLSTLVQSHINDLSLDSSSRIKEALAQDFREAFASKIGRAFARSLFAELNIKENIPQQGILKQELKLLSACFYEDKNKHRPKPLIERNLVLLKKELDNQIKKPSTKPFEREFYAHALNSMVA